MTALPESGDCISRDDQIPVTPLEAAHYTDGARPVYSHSLDHLLVPSWIIALDPRNTAGKNGMLHVSDVQAVLGQFFHSMRSHVVLAKPNLFPDPSYP